VKRPRRWATANQERQGATRKRAPRKRPCEIRWSMDNTIAEVESALAEFVAAFNDLDWERFRACFAPDATVFFPARPFPTGRATSWKEVAVGFAPFFANLRATALGPPYQQIAPRDLLIQPLGDAALVTFHLPRETALGRRTLVLRKTEAGWKIVHLHASLL
jgi:ketosteroid isomerase-like protein